MDFLNKAFAQVSDLFRSMTPGARITAGLLLAVIVTSLGYLFSAGVAGPDTDLMSGVPIDPSHLLTMEAAFANANLNTYEIRGTQIRIPRGQRNRYMAALAEAKALPPNIDKMFDDVLENISPFMPAREREERLKIAKQRTLAMIISSMKGIGSAYVLYDTKVKSGFKRETVTTAAASVQAAGSVPLDESQVSAIRHLVAGAIAGLKPENVTVHDRNGSSYYGGGDEGGGSGLDDSYISRKQIHEQRFTTKVLNALAWVPGVKVTLNAELDRERISRTQSVKYDPKATALQERDESSTASREDTGVQGRPGYQAQQPNVATALAASRTAGSHEEEEATKREVLSVTDTERMEVEKVGLTPERVTAAIGIPSSYFEKLWREENPPAEGEEPKQPTQQDLQTVLSRETPKIQQYVAKVLPPPTGVTDLSELVTVAMFQDIAPPEIPGPTASETAVTWFGEYWTTLGMIGLALFSLMILRSMVRSGPTGAEVSTPVHHEEEDEVSEEEAVLRRLGRFTGTGKSLRDELSELVEEDPDAAANILKTWIGTVG
ncbi:MAG: hypothetical protein JXB62_20985 [Pirellulales bacterium]|nr:hypothetical protein [Pirellulales bacterium]